MLWELYDELARLNNQFLVYRYGAHSRLLEDIEARELAKEINCVRFDTFNKIGI